MRRTVQTLALAAALLAALAALAPSALAAPARPTGVVSFADASAAGGRGLVAIQKLGPRRLGIIAILIGLVQGDHTISLARASDPNGRSVPIVTARAIADGATVTVRTTVDLPRALPLRGWIARWEGPDLDATKNEVAIETLEIVAAAHVVGPTGDAGPDGVAVVSRVRATQRIQAAFAGLAASTRHVLGFYSLPEVGDEVLLFRSRFTTDVGGAGLVDATLAPVRQAKGKAPLLAAVDLLGVAPARGDLVLGAPWSYRSGGVAHEASWDDASSG
ncbi:MAG: hypothetical protein R3C15_21685 [Thermoleophilia bacterium]